MSGLGDKLKSYALYPLPHHAISRVVFWLTRRQTKLAHPLIRAFCSVFKVDMGEALHESVEHYASFNAFFTRELKPTARVIAPEPDALACPVDGTVSQTGSIHAGELFQAKGRTYSLLDLLGGDSEDAEIFHNGSFATLYLSPRDYHRIHMPVSGTLELMTYIPGRLFSVAPHTVREVPGLFARNERVVTLFDTPAGKIAMILVGAINVAAIETVWSGLVTPPRKSSITRWHYTRGEQVALDKGEEMGRFNMGSTVILLCERHVSLHARLKSGKSVKMGESIGTFVAS